MHPTWIIKAGLPFVSLAIPFQPIIQLVNNPKIIPYEHALRIRGSIFPIIEHNQILLIFLHSKSMENITATKYKLTAKKNKCYSSPQV